MYIKDITIQHKHIKIYMINSYDYFHHFRPRILPKKNLEKILKIKISFNTIFVVLFRLYFLYNRAIICTVGRALFLAYNNITINTNLPELFLQHQLCLKLQQIQNSNLKFKFSNLSGSFLKFKIYFCSYFATSFLRSEAS
jgi:hypothetical protein